MLIPISVRQCVRIANDINLLDDDAHRSTWLFDKVMQHGNIFCYAIDIDNKLAGFTVLREGAFGIWLFWISIYPAYRRVDGIAKRESKRVLDIAFYRLNAKAVQSEVFEDNVDSMGIHRKLDPRGRFERHIDGMPVWVFVMFERKWKILRKFIF